MGSLNKGRCLTVKMALLFQQNMLLLLLYEEIRTIHVPIYIVWCELYASYT